MAAENRSQEPDLADLVDDLESSATWQTWLDAHPREAAEIAAARQIRALVQQLRTLSVDVPADIETRVLSNVHGTAAVRELLNLNLSGSARALLELMALLFSFLPASPPEESPAPRSA